MVITSALYSTSVEFRTSPDTKPGFYTIRAEDDAVSQEILIEVLPDILPPPRDPDTVNKVIYHPLVNPDIPAPVTDDLKRVKRCGTVYVGEDGLNLTEALAEADTAAVPPPLPEGTVIGWWPPAWGIPSSPAVRTLNLAGHENKFYVSPAEFSGFIGTWYLIDPSTGMAALDAGGSPIPVLDVADPSLDLRIWDLDTWTDVTGKSVPQGERLTFRVDTNLWSAFDSQYRPDVTEGTPGVINIIVRSLWGAKLNYLYQNNTTAISLRNLRVERQPWLWGSGDFWGTDVLDRDHYYFYPAGTYIVWAESTLNNMKANYKNAGADYTGKTVSQSYTITIVPETVKIESDKDTVTRGRPFSVTVTGKPGTVYYLWVKDTGGLTGGPNNQAPMITPHQVGVSLDSPTGPSFPIGSYRYENGGGRTIKKNVGTDPVYNGTRYYAKIVTSAYGTRTIEFETDSRTRAMEFTVRAENRSGARYMGDEARIRVARSTPASEIGVFHPSTRTFSLKNGSGTMNVKWGLSTDKPVSGDWNGDGLWDVGVFRPSLHTFLLKNGTRNTSVKWGLGSDRPVSGDWNGDGLWDVGVFRPSTRMFYLKNGTRNTTAGLGIRTDKPVSGDWNGDGIWDVGVFRSSTQTFILKNGTRKTTVSWGLGSDRPVSGDWNGDGLWDIGVFRPGLRTFLLKNGTENTSISWGQGTDQPLSGRWS